MLTPEYLQRIIEATEVYVSDVNDYLTGKIVKRLMQTFEKTGEIDIIPSSLLDIKKQENAGKLYEEIQDDVVQRIPVIKKEVKQAFLDAAEKIDKEINTNSMNLAKEFGIDTPDLKSVKHVTKESQLNMTKVELARLRSAYEATNGDMVNFTRTAPTGASQTYIQACDDAYSKIMHGVSPNTAIVEAIKEVSKRGIEVVSYGGRKERIEVAIARAVRTGVNKANGDITLTRAAETGMKYVIVSQHVGARVTATEDFTNHSWWQGQVYSLDWKCKQLEKYTSVQESKEMPFLSEIKSKIESDKELKYKDFITTCGYGQMLGICGINCRHSFGLFYPGVTVNNNKPIGEAVNKSRYQEEQKQRAMEREIRKTKRTLHALKEADSVNEEPNAELQKQISEATDRLRKQSDAYMDYCKDTGLKPINWRLQIAKINGVENKTDNIPKEEHNAKKFPVRTEEQLTKVAQSFQKEMKDYTENESKWSGKIIVDNKACNEIGANGTKEWSCDIMVKDQIGDNTIYHEMLHSASLSRYGINEYVMHAATEEGAVELLTQEICKSKGIYFNPEAYKQYTTVLRVINANLQLCKSDFEFAKMFYNIDMRNRYTWFEQKVSEYVVNSEMSIKDASEIMDFISILGDVGV